MERQDTTALKPPDPLASAEEPVVIVAADQSAEHREKRRWQALARLGLSSALLVLGAFIIADFVRALAWAVIFAIALWPLYDRTCSRAPKALQREAVPLLFTLLTGFVFLLPIALLGLEAVREVHQLVDFGRHIDQTGVPMPDFVARLPFGAAAGAWWDAHLAHEGWMKDFIHQINTSSNRELGRAVGASVVHRAFLFVISLLTLFFLFRDGRSIARQTVVGARKLFGERGERVARHMAVTVHATVNGLVLVGLGEGVLLGFAYFLAHVPHPLLFGVLAAAAALIPFASYPAIAAAALTALATGGVGPALAVGVAGLVVVFVADHFVRPTLIGGTTKLPFLWVLLGILGGVESLQLLGLFIGPAVMAGLVLLWRELVSDPAPTLAD